MDWQLLEARGWGGAGMVRGGVGEMGEGGQKVQGFSYKFK